MLTSKSSFFYSYFYTHSLTYSLCFTQFHAILFLPHVCGSNPLLKPPQCKPLHVTSRRTHTRTASFCFVSTHSPENSQEHCRRTAFPGLSSSLWPPSHKTVKNHIRRKQEEEVNDWVSSPANIQEVKYTHCVKTWHKIANAPETAAWLFSNTKYTVFSRNTYLPYRTATISQLIDFKQSIENNQKTIYPLKRHQS